MEQREKRKVGEIAKKYKKLGYRVYSSLRGYESPFEINGITPDLIITKDKEVIIVEVKSNKSLKEQISTIQSLADYARSKRNVRFDLVLTNPSKIRSKHVIPYKDGWAIKSSDSKRYISFTKTKVEATRIATEIAKKQRADLVIHGKNGKILERNSYGSDSKASKKK